MVDCQLYKSYVETLGQCLKSSEQNISDRKNAVCVNTKANIYLELVMFNAHIQMLTYIILA